MKKVPVLLMLLSLLVLGALALPAQASQHGGPTTPHGTGTLDTDTLAKPS